MCILGISGCVMPFWVHVLFRYWPVNFFHPQDNAAKKTKLGTSPCWFYFPLLQGAVRHNTMPPSILVFIVSERDQHRYSSHPYPLWIRSTVRFYCTPPVILICKWEEERKKLSLVHCLSICLKKSWPHAPCRLSVATRRKHPHVVFVPASCKVFLPRCKQKLKLCSDEFICWGSGTYHLDCVFLATYIPHSDLPCFYVFRHLCGGFWQHNSFPLQYVSTPVVLLLQCWENIPNCWKCSFLYFYQSVALIKELRERGFWVVLFR